MAPRLARRSYSKIPRTLESKRKDESKDGGDDDDSGRLASRMGLVSKLMLSSGLWGMEASVNFEQLYTIPVLQTLGMPLSLSSVGGFISGPASMLLLPVLGRLTDRGSNIQRRKTIAIIFASMLLVSGILSIITANMLHLQYLLSLGGHTEVQGNISLGENTSLNVSSVAAVDNRVIVESYGGDHDGEDTAESGQFRPFAKSGANSTDGTLGSGAVERGSFEVPFKAGLGFVGFVLLDMGYDASYCFVRTFMLTCSPLAEHTSLLVVGVLLASAGGVSTAILGLVDFTNMLGLGHIDGATLTVQTSVQGLFIIVFVVLGLLVTLKTGQPRHAARVVSLPIDVEPGKDKVPQTSAPRAGDAQPSSSTADTLETSVRSFSAGGVYLEASLAPVQEEALPNREGVPLLCEQQGGEGGDRVHSDVTTSLSLSYGAGDSTLHASQLSVASPHLQDVPEDQVLLAASQARVGHTGCLHSLKLKLALVCLANFFAVGVIVLYTYTLSDYIGKAIYGGDPAALPGSDSLSRYQAGMKMASWGFLFYYGVFLIANILHSRILAVVGYRLEFILLHLLVAGMMAVVAMTTSLAAVFALTLVAALQRASFYSVPCAVANDIAQAINNASGKGVTNMGTVISLLTTTIPMGYCLLFTWVGPLEQLNGHVTTPLWMGCGCACACATAFSFVGSVH